MNSLNFNSVETLPGFNARAAFQVNSASVFREDVDISFEPAVIFENPENKKTARCCVAHCFCGVSEIRTRDTLLAYTRFPDFSKFQAKSLINNLLSFWYLKIFKFFSIFYFISKMCSKSMP